MSANNSEEPQRTWLESNWLLAAVVAVPLLLWLGWLNGGGNAVRVSLEQQVKRPPAEPSQLISGTAQFVVPASPAASGARPTPEAKGTVTLELQMPHSDDPLLGPLGLSGDAFGGFNALASALACFGVFLAAILQRRTLQEVRQAELLSDRARRFEQTRGTFFEMLGLARELSRRIHVPADFKALTLGASIPPEAREGEDALDSLAASIESHARNASELSDMLPRAVVRFHKVYKGQPSRMGPYFRLLFQIFKLIDTAPIQPPEKLQLANIARGQISEGAVFLLALNSLTWRGWAFAKYVEDYGLLEHMHPTYRKNFQQVLEKAFDKNAFLGSEDRKARQAANLVTRGNPTEFDQSDEALAYRAQWLKENGFPPPSPSKRTASV